jgi:hypothetical protein
VNGDGQADLLFGGADSGLRGENSGVAYLVYGRAPTGEVDLADADVIFAGQRDWDLAGKAVSTAGDINGDGLDDMLVGAPGFGVMDEIYSDDRANGAVYVMLGGDQRWVD